MNAIIAWLWKHRLAVGFTIAVTGFVGSYAAWLDAHDELVATRAVANERLTDYRQANARADSLHKVHARTDSQVAVAQAHISQLRERADSLREASEVAAHEASIRATQAGDSLTATLDSAWNLAVKAQDKGILIAPQTLKPLITTAQTQLREARKARRDAASAFRTQLNAMNAQLTAADSTTRLWQTRYGALEDAYDARGEALSEARETVEAMAAGQDTGWGSSILYTGAGALVGAILWATFGP